MHFLSRNNGSGSGMSTSTSNNGHGNGNGIGYTLFGSAGGYVFGGHGRALGKSFRWLRWSTLCAILFYVFFIGLILRSTNHKLQHTLKSSGTSMAIAHQHNGNANANRHPDANHNRNHNHNNNEINVHTRPQLQQQQQQLNRLSSKSNVLQMPPSAAAASTSLQHQPRHGDSQSDGKGNGNGNNKINEPETVILAASSVNEKQILEKTFRRADKNQDGRLSIQELAFYINRKINEHIDDAIQRNPREFRRVDIAPADGLISWEEYHGYFVREHGLSDADLDEHGEIRPTMLNRHTREQLLRDKARWMEVARTDVFSLTIDEFLAFRHPESSVTNLLELVDDLLRQFDQDGDDQLSLEEFSDVTVNDDEDLIRKSLISRTVVERRAEFKRILDRNHDGKADREELLHYVDPKTPRYALQESATLFALADENHDNSLTLDELVANAEMFLSSKMIDTANSFHTEF